MIALFGCLVACASKIATSAGSSAWPPAIVALNNRTCQTLYCKHLDFGPLRLLDSITRIEEILGRGTPAVHCYNPPGIGECDNLLKYADGNVLLTLNVGIRTPSKLPGTKPSQHFLASLFWIDISRDSTTKDIARVRPDVAPVTNWTWEGRRIVSAPSSPIPNWTIGRRDARGRAIEYCGGGGLTQCQVSLTYRYIDDHIVGVSIGTE